MCQIIQRVHYEKEYHCRTGPGHCAVWLRRIVGFIRKRERIKSAGAGTSQ